MLFHSFEFLLFFGGVLLLHHALAGRVREVMLLLASYAFYMAWNESYVVLIMISTGVDYFAGLAMGRAESRESRKRALYTSLGANLGLLAVFKYAGFLTTNLAAAAGALGATDAVPVVDLLLPVGISFYTFQSLGYAIDVYRGEREPERDLLRFALFVSFFPQLVAGPIERSAKLLPQLIAPRPFESARFASGIRLIAWGFFKKLVVADRLGVFVDVAWMSPESCSGTQLLLALYFFAFQIYCDFSAYIDIARGAARCLGVDLSINFQRPYAAPTLREFWRRWHITLMAWFRDYIYIPLGGSRTGHTTRNVLIVFLISGLWHGASWTFIAFGVLNGAMSAFGAATAAPRGRLADATLGARPRLRRALGVLTTFHLWVLSLAFFRAESVEQALYVIAHAPVDVLGGLVVQPFGPVDLLLAITSLVIVEVVEARHARVPWSQRLAARPRWQRWAVDYALIASILTFMELRSRDYIYFQF